ncbi:MAG: tRNA pseudouridine(55) synthase TruB [SAR202 cluster bacterium]|nr:tRNA pseudouridine(55) synthase TruB [SAR202 cluster bacterium]|tara:strand:- start:404 stop:1327 length:924 start_codon:yes stop_codon:yes gene_type:complete
MDGIFNINKPCGVTSTHVVRTIKRLTGIKKVGHAGTLDPLASGVLPICVGKATRVIEYLINQDRSYRAVINLGIQTDTFDKEGVVVSDKSGYEIPSTAEIMKVLESFIGDIEQIPPMYSAIKVDGKRLYDLARNGVTLELEPRLVKVFEISLLEWNNPSLDIKIKCGRGFYVRSLANDLGIKLGMGAYLEALTRLKHGSFHIGNSVDYYSIEKIFDECKWADIIMDIDSAITHLPKIVISTKFEEDILNGRPVFVSPEIPLGRPKEISRIYSKNNRFIGIIEFDDVLGAWRPKKVINVEVDQGQYAK